MIQFLVIVFCFLINIANVFSNEISIRKISINCGISRDCGELKKNFNSIRGTYVNYEHLRTVLKLYVINEGIQNFNYNLSGDTLDIKLVMKRRVGSVRVKVKGMNMGFPSILPIREDDYLDDIKIQKSIDLLKDIYINKGFPRVRVSHSLRQTIEKSLAIDFLIETGNPIKISTINIISDSEYLKDFMLRKIMPYQWKSFDLQKIKDVIEELRLLFVDYGYYLVQTNLKYEIISDSDVEITVEIASGQKFYFDVILNGKRENNIELKSLIADSVIAYKRSLNESAILQIIQERLRFKGFLQPDVKISYKRYKNKIGDFVNHYRINVNENERSYVNELEFRGNNAISTSELLKLYYDNAFELAGRSIYDEKYLLSFQEILRQEYIKRGYVNIFVEKFQSKYIPKTKNLKIIYRLREGIPAKVASIQLNGVSEDIMNYLLRNLQTKEKLNFNPIAFKQDLDTISNLLKKEGFYYSSISNIDSVQIVSYNRDNSLVDINIDIELDKRLYVNNIILVGNRRTRSKFILREILLRKGDVITPEVIDGSQTSLLSSGLFSSVNIKPIKNITNKADILISVREKDFGLVEFAPGIRTDLGPKVSTSISYNNIDGLNKKVSFKGQINQRIQLDTLDERRRQESNSLLEYNILVNYSENKIFDTNWDFSAVTSTTRRRFYSFDADIQRVGVTTSIQTSKWFSTSFTYQLETISQYDSSLEREHGHFQIGSLTPTLTFDFRDNRINPTKGSFFNLSFELANPTLLSQQNDELEINYYKIVSRNRFYAPIPNGVLAISLAAGYQKNNATGLKDNGQGELQTTGYIPNIKVFRLSGMDIVRGFEDFEINRLNSNQDISEVRVDDTAYLANLKIEPRFFLSDASMIGVFYDAGRVFVDSYDLGDLRSSMGLSFKYLTPVGSLDFDYGIKLLRKRDANGTLESPGRLHVSIGFF
jgi:outer membrane protein insertion porin family